MGFGRTNIHTGADLQSKAATTQYRDGWDRIFGKKKGQATEEKATPGELLTRQDIHDEIERQTGSGYYSPPLHGKEPPAEVDRAAREMEQAEDEAFQEIARRQTISRQEGLIREEGLANPVDVLEAAYWEFDARRKGDGPWKGKPQSERDAFKTVAGRLYLSEPAPVDGLPISAFPHLMEEVQQGIAAGTLSAEGPATQPCGGDCAVCACRGNEL